MNICNSLAGEKKGSISMESKIVKWNGQALAEISSDHWLFWSTGEMVRSYELLLTLVDTRLPSKAYVIYLQGWSFWARKTTNGATDLSNSAVVHLSEKKFGRNLVDGTFHPSCQMRDRVTIPVCHPPLWGKGHTWLEKAVIAAVQSGRHGHLV